MNRPEKMLVIGHRGAAGHEPENTLRSVRRALDMGVDGVEVDVHLVEGRLVVIHDERVDGTTDGEGTLQELGIEGVRRLNAGRGERIPFLEEVLDVVGDRAFVNVELKGAGTAGPVVEMLTARVGAGRGRERFLLSSFQDSEMRAVRGSGFPMGILADREPEAAIALALELGAGGVHLDRTLVGPGCVAAAHRVGLRVLAFTVNDPEAFAEVRNAGVDGIFTDFPDRFRS